MTSIWKTAKLKMAAYSSWATLPSIIIVEILSYLSLTDKLSATSTNKRWRNCLFHPSLWRKVSFKVNNGNRKRTKHLADMCGKFVREVELQFRSQNASNVREFLRLLNILSENSNLKELTIIPTSCQIAWPEREPRDAVDFCLNKVQQIVTCSRKLRHFSLGCVGELTDHVEILLPLLTCHQAHTLRSLHLSSVKEDPDSYGLIEFPYHALSGLINLQYLGIDYDYLSNQMLLSLVNRNKAPLKHLIIHVHGIDPDHESVTNATWVKLRQHSPNLEVTLNLIHSMDGATNILDILQPAMPLYHIRMFFCQHLNIAGINYLAQHYGSTLQTIFIMDGMVDMYPNLYDLAMEEDPFVMLAWRCTNLKHFTFIGYDFADDDVIAIARLRGAQLQTLHIPLCCISSVEEDEVSISFGSVDTSFNTEVSQNLGFDWHPLKDEELHPAVKNQHADAETAYLPLLLQDQQQAW